jgi:predicted site-specific integrase-resolvase
MSHQEKQLTLWELTPEPLPDGQKMAKSRPSKPRQDKDVTISPNISNKNPVQLSLLDRSTVLYARVSTSSQRDDLKRQTEALTTSYPGAEVITEIGSGLNFRRRKLNAILERIISGDIQCLVVAHKDRLARFGFDLIEWLCEKFDCKLVVLYQQKYSPQAELVQDMLSVVHCFSSRVYGLRKYEKQLREDSEIQKQKTTLTEIDSEVSAELCEKNSGLS